VQGDEGNPGRAGAGGPPVQHGGGARAHPAGRADQRADAAYAIGATLDAEAARAECVDLLGVSRATVRMERGDLVDAIEAACAQASLTPADLTTIVAGLPYDTETDADQLEQRLGRPVDVRTNVELACLLEADAQDVKTFVYASLDPEPAVAAVAAGRTYTGPTSLLTRQRAAADIRETLADVVTTTCTVFDTPLVVLDVDHVAEMHPRFGRRIRMVASRAGAYPAARGARALALTRLWQSLMNDVAG
jgi:hypothetical protein